LIFNKVSNILYFTIQEMQADWEDSNSPDIPGKYNHIQVKP